MIPILHSWIPSFDWINPWLASVPRDEPAMMSDSCVSAKAASSMTPQQMASDRVEKILRKVHAMGLEPRHLLKISSVNRIYKQRSNKSGGVWQWLPRGPWKSVGLSGRQMLAVMLAAVVLPLAAALAVYTPAELVALWTLGRSSSGEIPDHIKCAIRLPDKVVDTFRPPVDCAMCEGLTTVDRVTNLDPGTFERVYAYSARPVIVADGARNWTATNVFELDFFKKVYGISTGNEEENETIPERSGKMNCQFFPYKTEFRSLDEALSMSEERMKSPWYFGWSNCNPEVASTLRRHYSRPYFLPDESESSKIDWIFMGTPGFGAHMHIDAVGKASWQAQIRGLKQWTLEPPPECYFSCPAGRIDVTIHPGEIFVLDTNKWFHKTLVIGDDISVVIGSEYD